MQLGKVSTEGQVWPTFFIVGAAKAGTTSLYEYLRSVPGIYMSSNKEPHFFAPNVVPNSYFTRITEQQEYLNLFDEGGDAVAIGESSPTYLWDEDAPKLIKTFCPEARIVILLRDPVQRAFSHYLHHIRDGWERSSFYEAVRRDYGKKNEVWKVPDLYVEQGLYYNQVKRFLDTFGPERVHISIFEEFIKEPQVIVREILAFLGVKSDIPQNTGAVYNPFFFEPRNSVSPKLHNLLSRIANRNKLLYRITHIIPIEITVKILFAILFRSAKKPQVPADARLFLRQIYQEDVKKLERLLNRQLPWVL